MKTFSALQTKWEGLWWHPEYQGFSSAAINLAQLREFKGPVRLFVRKNKFYNNGENGRPNYHFCLKDADSPTFREVEILDDEDADSWRYAPDGSRLYTEDEVKKVMHGACRDGASGYDEFDLLISDYV